MFLSACYGQGPELRGERRPCCSARVADLAGEGGAALLCPGCWVGGTEAPEHPPSSHWPPAPLPTSRLRFTLSQGALKRKTQDKGPLAPARQNEAGLFLLGLGWQPRGVRMGRQTNATSRLTRGAPKNTGSQVAESFPERLTPKLLKSPLWTAETALQCFLYSWLA